MEILWDAQRQGFPFRVVQRLCYVKAVAPLPSSGPAEGGRYEGAGECAGKSDWLRGEVADLDCAAERNSARAGVPVPLGVAKALVGWGKLQ